MARAKRTDLAIEAGREASRILAIAGAAVRAARRRRGLTQASLARRAGVSRQAISALELARLPAAQIRDLVAMTVALGVPLRLEVGRDPRETTVDAGHLAIQELLLRLGRDGGYDGTFELPIRAVDPRHSIDVLLRDRRRRRLVVCEAWNSVSDLGAAIRSFDRKLAAARELALGRGDPEPAVHGLWVVRATRRNRELVARYPRIFGARFTGSSRGWVRALALGDAPPAEPGLVWSDVAATRLFAWRRHDRPSGAPLPYGSARR